MAYFSPEKERKLRDVFLNIGLKLRGNIVRTANLQWAQLTKTVHTARLGHEFVFVFFGLHDLSLCSRMFCFTLDS